MAFMSSDNDFFDTSTAFQSRHLGPNPTQTRDMLDQLGLDAVSTLIQKTLPDVIRSQTTAQLRAPTSEQNALDELKQIAQKNKLYKSFIGMGYYDTHVPKVILRNVLENPGWYTAYTPYQPEIAQGRLEGLLNFQQMIVDLTGLELANASLLDEGTAAAEAMAMCKRLDKKNSSQSFFIADDVHPQTIAVVKTRALHFGFNVIVGNAETDLTAQPVFGALLQYPGTTGEIKDLSPMIEKAHQLDILITVATDLLSLTLLKPPGELGADIVVGTTQRLGVPMGFGGPHAAFFAFKEAHKRAAPGRIMGVSIDRRGKTAIRMAMQTREQHIRREKANSNICTSQVLLALVSVFYAIYHGPQGLTQIARRVHGYTLGLANQLTQLGFKLKHAHFFDTLCIDVGDNQQDILQKALQKGFNLRIIGTDSLGISLDETTQFSDVEQLVNLFSSQSTNLIDKTRFESEASSTCMPSVLIRQSSFLTHPVFNTYHSETEMLRYLKRLENKDIALNHAMIPLGSCTMKLNATAEMIPITWPEFSNLHPFAPLEQTQGYLQLFNELETMLMACTGYDAFSLQPNAGSQGEYAGLVAIKQYFAAKGETQRSICLIPASAHGTNPATAQMVNFKVVVVNCDTEGNVDITHLREKVAEYQDQIAALMVTYPSTHGVFEENIRDICALIHSVGAQVYIDGANLNALVGLAAPGEFGGDVSHLNLHKTFCIPHGGGGPGMGPIGVKKHLAPYLPSHPIHAPQGTSTLNGTVSAAPWGSASILPISWMYIRMMGASGVQKATEYAILNANYVAKRLSSVYTILYTGREGFVAHECIVDLRPLKEISGISEEDIAKRLMDYGFHAPTMSFPVPGTLMIEPTESESKIELDKFCDAMLNIHHEIIQVAQGVWPRDNNPLKNAPHTLNDVLDENWLFPYSREMAARPLDYLKQNKIWPSVNRVDNVYGDRNLMCTCPSMSDFQD